MIYQKIGSSTCGFSVFYTILPFIRINGMLSLNAYQSKNSFCKILLIYPFLCKIQLVSQS